MDFRDKLLYVRIKLNLSQTELANKLNVSFSTINRWETGKVSPNRKAELALEIFAKENNLDLKEVEDK